MTGVACKDEAATIAIAKLPQELKGYAGAWLNYLQGGPQPDPTTFGLTYEQGQTARIALSEWSDAPEG